MRGAVQVSAPASMHRVRDGNDRVRRASSTARSLRTPNARLSIAGICQARQRIAARAPATTACPARGRSSAVTICSWWGSRGPSIESANSANSTSAELPRRYISPSIADSISRARSSIAFTDLPPVVRPFTSSVIVGRRQPANKATNVPSTRPASPEIVSGGNVAPAAQAAAKAQCSFTRICNRSSQLQPSHAGRSQSVP